MPFPHFVSHENAFDRVHGAEIDKKMFTLFILKFEEVYGHNCSFFNHDKFCVLLVLIWTCALLAEQNRTFRECPKMVGKMEEILENCSFVSRFCKQFSQFHGV